MNNILGDFGIALAGAATLASVVLVLFGMFRREVAPLRAGLRLVYLAVAGLVFSFVILERALITRDFTVRFVAEHGSSRTSPLFNFTSLWSGLEGSILLWALVLVGFWGVVAYRFRAKLLESGAASEVGAADVSPGSVSSSDSVNSHNSNSHTSNSLTPSSRASTLSTLTQSNAPSDTTAAWAFVVIGIITAFFIGLLLGPADPFSSFSPPAGYDGPGPDPLLQSNVLMAFHPPMLYLGYVGFTVPFAFAIGALISGRHSKQWLKDCRTFTLVAWGFLTIGIVLGAWWSYDTLGWGGYWGWDPVENASLLPWLCGTAFLHSAMAQESRGILVVWNISLICAAFNLTILGTFLTRSGVLVSVHSFTESAIGPALLGFFGFSCLACVGLVAWRAGSIRGGRRLQSAFNRTGSLIANNFVFAAFTLVVLLGTMFPLVSEAVTGDQVSVGAPYFNQMTTPLGLLLLFLMAVSPMLPWGNASSAELNSRLQLSAWVATATVVIAVLAGVRGWAVLLAFGLAAAVIATAVRRLWTACSKRGARGLTQRAGGGMVAHIGLAIMALALAASGNFLQQDEVTLAVGDSGRAAGYEIELVAFQEIAHPERLEQRAVVRVGGQRLAPAVDRFIARGRIVGNPDTASSPVRDVQVSVVSLPDGDNPEAVLRVTVQPMVLWLWVGGGIIGCGVVLCLWPKKRARQDKAAGERALAARREKAEVAA